MKYNTCWLPYCCSRTCYIYKRGVRYIDIVLTITWTIGFYNHPPSHVTWTTIVKFIEVESSNCIVFPEVIID